MKKRVTREIRFLAKKGDADTNYNIAVATDCLNEKDRVKLAVVFRGRAEAHVEEGQHIMNDAIAALVPRRGRIVQPPEIRGSRIVCTIAPHGEADSN